MRNGWKVLVAATTAALGSPTHAGPVAALRDAAGEVTILSPLQLTEIDHLDFGTVIPSDLPGVVMIDAMTSGRTIAGGVTGVVSDAGHRAYFGTAGSPNQQVIILITPPTALTNGNGDMVLVLGLTLDGPPIRTIDPATRAAFFAVGGAITIAADQPEGTYDGTYQVSVNYL